MALQSSNTTGDIYRSGNAPPAAPNLGAVPCLLIGDFGPGQLAGPRAGLRKARSPPAAHPTADDRSRHVCADLEHAGADWDWASGGESCDQSGADVDLVAVDIEGLAQKTAEACEQILEFVFNGLRVFTAIDKAEHLS